MIKVRCFRIDIEKELEKVDEDDKPKGRSFVDGKEVKDIPEQVDAKGDLTAMLPQSVFFLPPIYKQSSR